jgi:hypothetical protein
LSHINKVREDFIIKELAAIIFPHGVHDRARFRLTHGLGMHLRGSLCRIRTMGILIHLLHASIMTNTAIAMSSKIKRDRHSKVMGGCETIDHPIQENTSLICFFALLLDYSYAEFLTEGWNTMWPDSRDAFHMVTSEIILHSETFRWAANYSSSQAFY